MLVSMLSGLVISTYSGVPGVLTALVAGDNIGGVLVGRLLAQVRDIKKDEIALPFFMLYLNTVFPSAAPRELQRFALMRIAGDQFGILAGGFRPNANQSLF